MFVPWPHQPLAVSGVEDRRSPGRALALTIPTGGGKSWVVGEYARRRIGAGGRLVIYTNRRILVKQLSETLARAGIDFGVRAAGHRDDRHLPVQVSSLPTEYSRVLKREAKGKAGAWPLHDATDVVVDEAHSNTGPQARRVLDRHREAGAFVLGPTATPVGLSGTYDDLFVAATNSQLRRCRALVPARHTGPDEPDLRNVGRIRVKLEGGEDVTEAEASGAIMRAGVAGRVWDSWRRDNPDARPAILFAPGVAESVWFCEQFYGRGVPCAHVDGEKVWWDGKVYDTTDRLRDEVIEASRLGDIKILSNRFVMREGVDMPWLYQCVLATVFGSLSSYLQAVGRTLRYHETTPDVVVTDHGGNWWRLGSVNADRDWRLGDTNASLAARRMDQLRGDGPGEPGDDPRLENCARCGLFLAGKRKCPACEPRRCPECFQIVATRFCPCGYEYRGVASRSVVQSDGSLIDLDGPAVRPRQRTRRDDTAAKWERVYYRARNAKKRKMTFREAEGLFHHENGYWPTRNLPLMPAEPVDWYSYVKDVPADRLVRKP